MLVLERLLVLKSVAAFSGAADEVLAELAAVAELEAFDAGETVLREGALGHSLYVVTAGRVRVEAAGRTLAELGEREVFGELSVLDPEPRSASVVALEPTRLLRLTRQALRESVALDPEVGRSLVRFLCQRLRAAREGPTWRGPSGPEPPAPCSRP